MSDRVAAARAELERRSRIAAAEAELQRRAAAPNTDGTYGQPPEGMFVNPHTGQMTSRELLAGNVDTSGTRAAMAGALSGYTLGSFDEMVGGATTALKGEVAGNFAREKVRAEMGANATDYPVATVAGEVAGAVVSPVAKVLPNPTTIRGAATVGGVMAAVDGFNRGEGGVRARLAGGAKAAPVGLFSSGLTGALFKGGSAGVKGLTTGFRRLVGKVDKRPTVEGLKAVKNQAYSAVRNSGDVFDEIETTELGVKILDLAGDVFKDADPQTVAALASVERRAGSKMTLDDLDSLRQIIWKRYSRGSEPVLLEMISEIDDLVATHAGSSELMQVARTANSQYSKALLLENAFKRARLQTAATGSGGNILNKYRQAVVSILTKPHEAKWFSPEELAMMEHFVEGDVGENAMRRIGKLAPGGNGLMTALNVYAATVDPAMLAVTGAASAAKGMADSTAMRGSERLLDSVSTGVIKPPATPMRLGAPAAAAGIIPNRLLDR